MISRGITFNNFHSYRDLGLVLTDVDIPPAVPKTSYIDIPGKDEPLDTTESLGEVKYNPRDCKFTFVVRSNNEMTFEDKKTQVSNLLNGAICKIVLDADDRFYYYGRTSVNSYLKRGNLEQIVIGAKVQPYKLMLEETIISANIETEANIICANSRKSIVPTITTDADFILKFNDISVAVPAGEKIVPDIKFVQGENVVTCIGTGNITFTYREGSL